MTEWILAHWFPILIGSTMTTAVLSGGVVVLVWIIQMFVCGRVVAREVETPVEQEPPILRIASR